MAYVDHIRTLNRWNPGGFLPFVIDGIRMGWIRHGFASQLSDYPDCFVVSSEQVSLNLSLQGFEQRSYAVARVIEQLVDCGIVDHMTGEMFPVLSEYGEPEVLKMDRAAVSHFGIRAFGQHLNGYVQSESGLKMWIGQRAADRRAFPGRLDHLVAGGLPYGFTLAENLAKECMEEAGISHKLASRAKAVGQVSYCCEVERGLRQDTLFCYDLLLPESFVPRCSDGEVAGFELIPVGKVAAIVRDSEAFKPNCNLVMIDFLIRHGFIEAGEIGVLEAALHR